MASLQKFAQQVLEDIYGISLRNISQYDIKLDVVKEALQEYHKKLSHQRAEKTQMTEEQIWVFNQFDEFWKKYGKKVGRTPALKKWMKLQRVDVEKILETVDAFVLANPDLQYRPHPITYLNQRRWEDELPTTMPKKIEGGKQNTWSYSEH
jgi:hypothetical protein